MRVRRVFAGCEALLVRHRWLPFNEEAARRIALKGGFVSVLQALAELPKDATIRELLGYFVYEEEDAFRFLEAYIEAVSQKCPV